MLPAQFRQQCLSVPQCLSVLSVGFALDGGHRVRLRVESCGRRAAAGAAAGGAQVCGVFVCLRGNLAPRGGRARGAYDLGCRGGVRASLSGLITRTKTELLLRTVGTNFV